MITDHVQRWDRGGVRWRPPRAPADTRRLEVAAIEHGVARAFVELHHYEHSWPAAVLRFGLFERGRLVGACVFAEPVNRAIYNVLPDPAGGAHLSRLVLLDEPGANAESWFVARVFELARREGITGVISMSDPLARERADGSVVTPGHVGTVYQALNATYYGRSKPERRLILPDGAILQNRKLAKIRARERGWRPAVEQLVELGAAPLRPDEDARAWLSRWLPVVARAVRHPGQHRYAWALDRGGRRHLDKSLARRGLKAIAFPKFHAPSGAVTRARAA